ncbi:MAG TPA: ATP-binding cassette domain-containing protein [Candidatus Dormibacteraeota bacterium]|nr:ATP-binding cassette domain-containing protein [Candidatus Dormibacteraeota bacterium]
MLIEVERLSKHFGGIRAVDDVSLAISPGELVGLIGPNGSGKTTLINLMSGALQPDEGEIRMGGTSMAKKAAHTFAHHGVGRTFQVPRLFRRMTVLENLMAPALTLKHSTSHAAQKRALDVLAFLRLRHLARGEARALSGGQQKLLELGRALMLEPRLLLLDEPFAGVHPRLLDELCEHVVALNREGYTIVVVDHNLDAVKGIVRRLVVMARGRGIADGPPDEVLRHAEVISAYTGA